MPVPKVTFDSLGCVGRLCTIQYHVILTTGIYNITAAGASGGLHTTSFGNYRGTFYGGKGAVMRGNFELTEGTVLLIVVGLKGGDSVEVEGGQTTTQTAASLGLSIEDNAGTGGGGGSFVYTSSNILLIAAGGGGGATAGWNGVDGQAGESGTKSIGKNENQRGTGGTNGQPGRCCNSGSYPGGLGAGWNGQGAARSSTSHGERGGSRQQGWVGGLAGAMNSGSNGGPAPGAVGGFGGGGGGAEDNGASGGGGGYSGGGSGTHPNQAGGGGGSYCSGSMCSGVTGENPYSDGYVTIQLLA